MNTFQRASITVELRQPALRRVGLALLLAFVFAAFSTGSLHAQTPPAADGGICAPTLLPLSGQQARAVNSEPALDNSGSRASFWSTANPQNINTDGSIEMFSADMSLNESTAVVNSTVAQLTESRGNILGGFNIMPDVASAVLNGSNNAFTVFASDRDLAPTGTTNNSDGGFEIFLARRVGGSTLITQLTNTRRSASILPSISNLYPEASPRYANIAFVSDADDKGIVPKGQADNSNYEVYVMKLDLSVWPPARPDPLLQVTQTPNNVNNDKPAISLLGNAVVFLSDGNGALRPGATSTANNADRNSEVFRALFTRPDAAGTVTFDQVTTTAASIENDFPDTNADGSQVVYSSTETNFATPAANPGSPTVYVSTVGTGPVTYTPLSSSLKANPAHPTIAKEPAINGRGDRIVFAADACDPSASTCAQPVGQYQVFAADQDIQSKKFVVAQVTSQVTTTHEAPAISGDGRFIALVTSEGNAASNPDLSGSEVAILYCPVARLEPIKTVDTISPSLAEDRPDVGDIVDYVVSLNNGSLTSFDGTMVLTDTLPGQVQYISAATDVAPVGTTISAVSWNPATRLATWTVDKLPRGQKATVRLRVKILPTFQNVPTGGQTVTNRVNMTTTAPVDEIQSGLVKIATEATADLNVTRVDLSAAVAVSNVTPREQETFFITLFVTNTVAGPNGALDPATSVRLTTTLPALLADYAIVAPPVISGTYSSATGVWSIPQLEAGKSAQLRFSVTANAGSGGKAARSFALTGISSDQQDNNAVNNLIAPTSRTLRVLGTDLALISKTVDKQGPSQFSDVTYTIVMTNSGPLGPLTDSAYLSNPTGFVPNKVTIIDPLPAGLEYVSASNGGSLQNGQVVWQLPGWPIGAPADQRTVTFTAKVLAAPGTSIKNTVSSVLGRFDSEFGPLMPDPAPANNAPASSSASFTTNQPAAVNLQIKPQPGRIDEGQQVTLTVRYSDPDALDSHVIAVNWGDSTPITSVTQLTSAVTTQQVNFLHKYADDNATDTYSISATVTDNNGSAAQSSANVTVNNVLPVSTGLTVTQRSAVSGTTYIVRVGETLAFQQTFRDPGFTRPPLAETFSYTVAWGDVTDVSKPVTIVTQGSPGVFTRGTINAAHIYSTPGTYTVRNTVRDDDLPATGPIGAFTVIVTVKPVAVDDLATITEDQIAPVNVMANDTGASVQLVSVTTPPITGTVALNTATGVITYTAAGRFDALKAGEQRKDFFDYRIRDAFNFTDTGRVTVTVTGVNDLPLVDLNGAGPGVTTTVAFTEDNGSKVIAPAITITDPDDANLTGATVQIQNQSADLLDSLQFTPAGAISGNYNSATGILTLTGTATKAVYVNVLKAVAYNNTSQNPDPTPRTLLFQVQDAQGGLSLPVAATVTVEQTDDPPVIATSGGTTSATEGATPTIIDAGVTITDVDSPFFTGGTLTVTVQSGESRDLLSILGNAIVTVNGTDVLVNGVSVGAVAGLNTNRLVVTLNGNASAAATQAVAQQVAYARQKGKPPASTSKVVAYTVSSSAGGAPSNTATKNLSLTLVNDAPAISFVLPFVNVSEDTATPIRGTFTVTDVDTTGVMQMIVSVANGKLTYAGAGTIANNNSAAVTVNATAVQLNQAATLIYTGNANYYGSDTLTVSVNDQDSTPPGPQTTITSTVFTVANINDAPTLKLTAVLTNTTASYTERTGPVLLAPAAVVADIDSADLVSATVRITNLQNAGQETLSATPLGGVVVAYNAATGRLTLANSASLAVYQAILQSVTYANSSFAPNTTARLIDFQVFDGPTPPNNASNSARATVNITAIDDPTRIITSTVPLSTTAQEGVAVQVDAGIVITDPDTSAWSGGYLTATVQSGGVKDQLAVVNGGLVTVSGANVSYNGTQVGTITGGGTDALRVNFNGAATLTSAQAIARQITYTRLTTGPVVSSRIIAIAAKPTAALPLSNVATRPIVLTAVNDPPEIIIGAISVPEDVPTNIRPSMTITDIDSPSSLMRMTVAVQNGSLSYVGPFANSGGGTNTLVITATLAQLNDLSNVTINYLSFLNASGADPLTVSVNDRDPSPPGPQTGTASGSITIIPVNDAPVLDLNGSTGGTGFTATFTENGAALAIVGTSGGTGLTVNDVDSANMLSATVQIANPLDGAAEVLAANPSATGIAVNYDSGTARLTLTGNRSRANYQTVLRTVTYRNTSENPNTSAARTINFQVFDTAPLGSALAAATVTVVATNDAPALVLAVVPSVNEDTPLSVGALITITDVDAAPSETARFTATVTANGTLVAGSVPPTVTVAGSGGSQVVVTGSLASINAWKALPNALVYQGKPNYAGSETLTINYRDGSAVATANLAATQQNRNFTVVAVDDPPVLTVNTGLSASHPVSPTTAFTDTITAAILTATDVDSPATGIVFTVITLPPGTGILKLNSAALAACGTFTQDDIVNGRVKYTYSSANVPISAPFPFNVGNAPTCAGPGTPFTIAITP